MTKEEEEDLDVAEANARIEEMYALLRADYRHSLPEKLRTLESVVFELDDGNADSTTFDNVLMQLHRTKGTIGSYGFTELSRMVEAIETLMKQTHRPPNQKTRPEGRPEGKNEELWQTVRKQVEEIFGLAKLEAAKLAGDTASDAAKPAQ